jgi:two-component system response regulator MprA
VPKVAPLDDSCAGGSGLTQGILQRILVIDDERLYCEAITDILLTRGFETRMVHSARAGLQEIERFRPQLVIADVMMPDMDGICLLREALARCNGRRPGWVVCSAKVSAYDRTQALEAGADAFLAKPFSLQDLMRTVSEVLALRSTLAAPLAG